MMTQVNFDSIGGGGVGLDMNSLIPNMTSATAPSGVVTTSSNNSSYQAYYAFSSSQSYGWCTASYSYSNDWIQYEFPTATLAKAAQIVGAMGNGTQNKTCKFSVKASNDSTFANPVTLVEDVVYNTNTPSGFVLLNNVETYKYYRFTIYDSNFNSGCIGLKAALFS